MHLHDATSLSECCYNLGVNHGFVTIRQPPRYQPVLIPNTVAMSGFFPNTPAGREGAAQVCLNELRIIYGP